MRRYSIVFGILFLLIQSSFAQNTKRFQSEVFTSADSILNIQYGEAINNKNVPEKLLLDFYSPAIKDTLAKRPLMIFIHGGGFQDGKKSGGFVNLISNSLAKRGYTFASIDYRLGINAPKSNQDYFEALYRAVQDGKAAVRYFKRYAEKYGIDTAQIFIMGSSAGAKTALHIAYLDQVELPTYIDTKKMGLLEGTSGNQGYSSEVAGVINCWGAMVNYQWINKNDAPLFCISGTADKTVPYDSSFDYHGFKYGSTVLYDRMLQLGIPTGLRLFYKTGHSLDNNKLKQDSAIQDLSAWLFTQLKINRPEKPEIFKWEEDIKKLEALDAKEKPNKNALLFVGSSYVRLWEGLNKDIAPYQTINRGFGGSKLNEVAYYIERLVYGHTFRGIVLYVGNDIVGSKQDKTPLQDVELVKYITKKIRVKFPTTPIFWNQISPSEKRWAVWDKISEANQMIKQFCEANEQVYYIESAAPFLGADGKPIASLFRDDKLHYNEKGYVIWGNIVKKSLDKVYDK